MKRWLGKMALCLALVVACMGLAPASVAANSPSDIAAAETIALADLFGDIAARDYAAAEDLTAAGVSVTEASHLFDSMAHTARYRLRYVADGCYARASS